MLLSGVLDELFSFLGAGLGLGLPALGIRPYPQGQPASQPASLDTTGPCMPTA